MPKIKLKTYSEILDAMIVAFSSHAGGYTEIIPGTIFHTIFSVCASEIFQIQQHTQYLLEGIDCYLKHPLYDTKAGIDIDVTLKSLTPIDFVTINLQIQDATGISCDCSKEKFGFAGHSTWCKAYKPNM